MKKKTQEINLIIKICRRNSPEDEAYWQEIPFSSQDPTVTVASALIQMNGNPDLVDVRGQKVGRIAWECSCLQKKCGACAMVINGQPGLACDSFLRNYQKKGQVVLEPLKKFPLVRDLLVDRSILYENLRTLRLWLQEEVRVADKDNEVTYQASRCLQCGCCLEVCPNFAPGGDFYGAPGFVVSSRLLPNLSGPELDRLKKDYLDHEYAGCGKSLACAKICPAGIPTEELLVNSNAIALSKRIAKGRKK
ncbi:MAG: succinate dehydrogenase [Eubacterium sp.]|nr:succinate dehydrogenase [Eubacterium sp.]